MYIIENPKIYNLVEISKELAFEKFPNRAIYYKKPNDDNLYFRCWWHEVNGHFHEFPHGENYKYFINTLTVSRETL